MQVISCDEKIVGRCECVNFFYKNNMCHKYIIHTHRCKKVSFSLSFNTVYVV